MPRSPVGSSDRREAPECITAQGLRIHSFGTFCVERAGLALLHSGSRARKAAILFKVLLSRSPRAVPEEEVMAILWSEASDGSATKLRSLLHQLRLTLRLGDKSELSIEHAGTTLTLKLGQSDWWDVAQFETFLREGARFVRCGDHAGAISAYTAAAGLYDDGYLADDAPCSWAASRRERLRQDWLHTLGELARLYAQQGEHAEQEVALRTLVHADPYREDSQRALMTLLASLGRGAESLLLYRKLEERLRDEFDALPDPETATLAQRIGRRVPAIAR